LILAARLLQMSLHSNAGASCCEAKAAFTKKAAEMIIRAVSKLLHTDAAWRPQERVCLHLVDVEEVMLIRSLGAGGNATCWLGRLGADEFASKHFVVKIYKEETKPTLGMAVHECAGAILFAMLQHRNLYQAAQLKCEKLESAPGKQFLMVFDFAKKLVWPTTEYVTGCSLYDSEVARKRYSPREAMLIASSLIDAVRYLRRHGLIYTDAHGGNIIIADNGEVVIIDADQDAIASAGYHQQCHRQRQ
jgi:serine/threonine protein kinase